MPLHRSHCQAALQTTQSDTPPIAAAAAVWFTAPSLAMGIQGLMQLLTQHAPRSIQSSFSSDELARYSGRTIAVDASLWLYQFLLPTMPIAAHDGQPAVVLPTEPEYDRSTTVHLQGMLERTLRMLQVGLQPVFVFDGDRTPTLVTTTAAARSDTTPEGLPTKADTVRARQDALVTPQHKADVCRLLTLMNLPFLEAPCEADAQCAALTKAGLVYAVASEGMDALVYGAPRILRHFSMAPDRRLPIVEIDLAMALKQFQFTMDQFIDLCILCGCDYTSVVRGIRPQLAFKLMQEHGSLQAVLATLDHTRIPSFDFHPAEVAALFRCPEVTPCDDAALKRKLAWPSAGPNESGLIDFLVGERGFSAERVKNACAKIRATRRDKMTQTRIEAFFKRAPTPAPAAAPSAAIAATAAASSSSSSSAAAASSPVARVTRSRTFGQQQQQQQQQQGGSTDGSAAWLHSLAAVELVDASPSPMEDVDGDLARTFQHLAHSLHPPADDQLAPSADSKMDLTATAASSN